MYGTTDGCLPVGQLVRQRLDDAHGVEAPLVAVLGEVHGRYGTRPRAVRVLPTQNLLEDSCRDARLSRASPWTQRWTRNNICHWAWIAKGAMTRKQGTRDEHATSNAMQAIIA